jgi:dolichol-phosphate mannosyltransferase
MRVSVIIPVYNELAHAREMLSRVLAARLPEGCEKEIIVIDDGSTDGTTELLREACQQQHCYLHRSILNFGKGTAIRIGLRLASGDIILVQDGDLEYDPSEYPRLIEPILRGEADVVYGSRFLGRVDGMRLPNLAANKLLTAMANLLYAASITDEATAYKVFRREVLDRIELRCHRFEFCPEVTAKLCRMGVRIHEVPISYEGRSVAQGKKIRWKDGVEAAWTLLKYRFAPRESFTARLTPSSKAVAQHV